MIIIRINYHINNRMHIRKKELLVCFYFSIITLMYGFCFTPLDITGAMHDILLYTAVLLACIVLIDNYNFVVFVKMVGVLLLSFFVFMSSHETIFIIMILSAFMIKNISYQKIFKMIFFERFIMLVIVLLYVLIDVINIGKIEVSKGIYGQVVAYSMGYFHPNNFAQEVFYLSTLYLCKKNGRLRNWDYGLILLMDVVTYLITRSKTACILIVIIIGTLYYINNFTDKKRYKIFSNLYLVLCVVIPLIGIASPAIILQATDRIQRIVYYSNAHLNQRISNAAMLYLSFPLTLFGKIIDLDYLKMRFGYNVVDNGYVYSLFNFGVIGFGLMITLYLIALKELLKQREVVYVTVIVATLCYAYMENILRAMYMNFCVLFWWEAISKNKKSTQILMWKGLDK